MTTAAVIGCGDVSVVHFEALDALADVELVAVCDTDEVTATTAAARHGVPAFTDHRELLAAARPDVVHVCTPHDRHADPAIDSLDAGVHVVLEKPVAHTLAEAERVVAAARRHPEVRIGVCLQNRYNATSRSAWSLLTSGAVGDVLGATATVAWHRTADYYAARPWRGTTARSGGGVLINQAIHTLDLVQWLVGDVVDVHGRADRLGDREGVDVEDTAQLLLDHASGARSVVFATVNHVVDSPVTVEIVAERAVLLVRGDLTVSHADGRVEVVPEPRPATGGRSYWGASHALLVADFYRSLADPGPFWIHPEEAAKSLRILARVPAPQH